MSIGKTPFRYDYVGSFLRPEALKKARCQFDEGKIGYEELKVVEVQHGIWILCGALMASVIHRPKQDFHSMERPQWSMIHIW